MLPFVTAIWLRYKSDLFPEASNPDLDISSYFVPAVIFTIAWTSPVFYYRAVQGLV
jgi:hypothetical protein